jgi:hypothetical protein
LQAILFGAKQMIFQKVELKSWQANEIAGKKRLTCGNRQVILAMLKS